MELYDMKTLLVLWANKYGDCIVERVSGIHPYHVQIATSRNWRDDYFCTAEAALNFIGYRA